MHTKRFFPCDRLGLALQAVVYLIVCSMSLFYAWVAAALNLFKKKKKKNSGKILPLNLPTEPVTSVVIFTKLCSCL